MDLCLKLVEYHKNDDIKMGRNDDKYHDFGGYMFEILLSMCPDSWDGSVYCVILVGCFFPSILLNKRYCFLQVLGYVFLFV